MPLTAYLEMIRVLFIAYHFPPVGGAGVQRSTKFVKLLPDFGVEPVVLAGPSTGSGRWELEDGSLSRDIPDSVPIYRPEGPAPEVAPLERRSRRLLSAQTRAASWWCSQIRDLGTRALSEHEVDLVFCTGAPFEGFVAALDLGREAGIPVVLDLRDPWALDEVQDYPSVVHRSLERNKMRSCLSRAAAVVMNTPEAQAVARRAFAEMPVDKFHCIPNGYDPDDFASTWLPPSDDELTVVHAGSLHTDRGLSSRKLAALLGGRLKGVRHLPRSHWYLVRAMERLSEEKPEWNKRWRSVDMPPTRMCE